MNGGFLFVLSSRERISPAGNKLSGSNREYFARNRRYLTSDCSYLTSRSQLEISSSKLEIPCSQLEISSLPTCNCFAQSGQITFTRMKTTYPFSAKSVL